MTEPDPTWFLGDSDLPEWQILAGTAASLRGTGWFVTNTAQDRPTRRQLSGLPDLIAAKDDHLLFVECKTRTGKLRKSQRKFAAFIAEHTGKHLQYVVIRHPAMIDEWLTPGQGAWIEETT